MITDFLRMPPNTAETLLGQTIALLKQGRLAEAESVLAQICEQYPDNDKAWYLSAVIRLESGDRDSAIEYLCNATRLQPANIEAHFTLCKLYLAQGNLSDAIPRVEKVVELDARHGPGWLALGSIYADAGRFAEAEQASRRALDLLPGIEEPKINLVNALISQGKRDEAIILCQHIREDNPASPAIWHSLGLAFKALALIQDADCCLTRVANAEPENAAALCTLGELKAAQGEVSQAQSLFMKSRALDPADAGVHFQLGKVLLQNSSTKHRHLLEELRNDYQYRDCNEAKNIAIELAADLQTGDAGVESALIRFFDEYDPAQLYPTKWWTDALSQFGDPAQASDTAMRSIFSAVFSWSLPCREALDQIAEFAGGRVASYGSGAAYWEYLLQLHYAIDLHCHDMILRHRFTAMEIARHSDARVEPADTIFLAWLPGDASIDTEIESLLEQLRPGQKLLLLGEPADENGHPRSCASHRFFRYLQENFETRSIIPLANYAYFHDRVECLVRK